MKIKIRKNAVTIMTFFIILMENVFYLIDTEAIHIAGAFAYSDIWLVLLIFYFGYHLLKYRKLKTKYYFGIQVAILVILVFISALQQNSLTGQSLWLGIRPQRNYLLILLTYFPMRKMFATMKIKVDELMNALLTVGTFSAGFFLLQKFTIDYVQFLNVIMGERNGVRFYIDSTLIQITAIIAIYKFSKEYKLKYLINLLICIAYEVWVSQGRLEIIAVSLTVLIGFLLTKKMSGKKLLGICCVIFAVFVFMNSSYADELWKAIATMNTATATQGNTMEIRYIGRVRYIEQLGESLKTFLLGCGYPNALYSPAAKKAGYDLGIGLNDNGIFGFTYIYGFIGLIVIVILMIKFLRLSYRLYKMNGNTVCLTYMILNICLGYNIIFWYWKSDGTFIMILMLCVVEHLTREGMKTFEGEKDNG